MTSIGPTIYCEQSFFHLVKYTKHRYSLVLRSKIAWQNTLDMRFSFALGRDDEDFFFIIFIIKFVVISRILMSWSGIGVNNDGFSPGEVFQEFY